MSDLAPIQLTRCGETVGKSTPVRPVFSGLQRHRVTSTDHPLNLSRRAWKWRFSCGAERRRNRTYPPPGYAGSPVLKTGWGTSPVPLQRRHDYGRQGRGQGSRQGGWEKAAGQCSRSCDIADLAQRREAAEATADGAALFYAFGNFCALAAQAGSGESLRGDERAQGAAAGSGGQRHDDARAGEAGLRLGPGAAAVERAGGGDGRPARARADRVPRAGGGASSRTT